MGSTETRRRPVITDASAGRRRPIITRDGGVEASHAQAISWGWARHP
jgi:hypothetical protein